MTGDGIPGRGVSRPLRSSIYKEVKRMTFQDILTLIGSYAFPIIMCIAFFWKLDKDSEQHKEEMDKMSEALNNNTLTIQRLIDHMEGQK